MKIVFSLILISFSFALAKGKKATPYSTDAIELANVMSNCSKEVSISMEQAYLASATKLVKKDAIFYVLTFRKGGQMFGPPAHNFSLLTIKRTSVETNIPDKPYDVNFDCALAYPK